MLKSFLLLITIVTWASIYPAALALGLVLSDQKNSLLWEIQFESHYLLAVSFIRDTLDALPTTSIWVVGIVLCKLMQMLGFTKLANASLIFYPAALLLTVFIADLPDLFWQMTLVGWVLNLFFLGKAK